MDDIISRAIKSGKYLSVNSYLVERSEWKIFKREARGKKVFLFGGTKACDFFLQKYGKVCAVEAVLDNDTEKEGHKYEEYSEIELIPAYKELEIWSPQRLDGYVKPEIAVIITSTNYYDTIARQLEGMGIRQYYAFLLMEAGRKRYLPIILNRKFRIWQREQTGWTKDYWDNVRRFHKFCAEPIHENKIVFMTFGKFMGHGKYIAREIQRQHLEYDIVWLVYDKSTVVDDGIRKVEFRDTESFCYELATAKIWVSDVELPFFIRKRKGQIYIQTKHWSSVTLKKFYFDAPTIITTPAKVKNWKHNFRLTDYMITGSDFDTETCRRGFRFDKEVWQIGSPRSDILFQANVCKEKIYRQFGIEGDKKTVIYAPTYRYKEGSQNNIPEVREIGLDYKRMCACLHEKFGGEWVVLLRLHPAVAKESSNMDLEPFVLDASAYEDGQELVAAADIMISDYSSIMFEPAFVYKPVFLFVTDYEEYVKREYDLLIQMDELPFPKAESNDELAKKINTFDFDLYKKNVMAFLTRYGVQEDGRASERAVNCIKALMQSRN